MPAIGGEPSLLKEMAKMLGVPPTRLAITSGVRSAVLPLAAGHPSVLVERPTFAQIPLLLEASGAKVAKSAWAEFGSHAGASLVWVTAPIRNPDGATPDEALLRALARQRDSGALVIVNEAYRWYMPQYAYNGSFRRVGTLAKLVGGASLGWIVLEDDAERDEAWDLIIRSVAPPVAWQHSWARFLRSVTIEELVESFIKPTQAAFDEFVTVIGDLPPVVCRNPPSVLVRLGNHDEVEVRRLLESFELSVGLGTDFLCAEPALRLCFTGTTAKEAAEAARRLRVAIDRSPRSFG